MSHSKPGSEWQLFTFEILLSFKKFWFDWVYQGKLKFEGMIKLSRKIFRNLRDIPGNTDLYCMDREKYQGHCYL